MIDIKIFEFIFLFVEFFKRKIRDTILTRQFVRKIIIEQKGRRTTKPSTITSPFSFSIFFILHWDQYVLRSVYISSLGYFVYDTMRKYFYHTLNISRVCEYVFLCNCFSSIKHFECLYYNFLNNSFVYSQYVWTFSFEIILCRNCFVVLCLVRNCCILHTLSY